MNKFAKYISFVAIVAFFITFWWLNTCFRYCSDDCFYGSLWTVPFAHLDTVANAFKVTCGDMHRPVVHFIVRCFCGVWPKCVFNLANTIMAGVLLLLIIRHAKQRWSVRIDELLLTIGLCFFCLFKGESITWVAGAVNYLWAGSAALAFCLLRRRLEDRVMAWPVVFAWLIPVFVLGWTMEGFVFPILFAIGLTTLLRKFKISAAEWILYIVYFLGALVLASAEGGRVSSISHLTPMGMTINLIKIAVGIKAVWLLVIAFVFIKDKRDWLRENRFELSVILGTVLMIIVAGFNGERSLWAANLFAIILLVKTWTLRQWQSVVLSLALLPLFVCVSRIAVNIRDEFDTFLSTYLKANDGVAPHRRVFAGPLSRFFYQEPYTWCSGVHGNNIANYYAKSQLPIGLPGDLYENLYLKDGFCTPDHRLPIAGDFYTTPSIPAIVHPLTKKVDESTVRLRLSTSTYKTQVNYNYPSGLISSIRRTLNLSTYPHPVETEKGYVLQTSHGSYLLISKEYGSDNYITSITLTPNP